MRPLALLVACLIGSPALADPVPDPAGTAQLPLSEILRLHRELDRASLERPEPTPVTAVVEKVEISGLLLDDAAELTAHVEAQVFAEGWSVLPLVKKDPQLHVIALPRVESGTLTVNGGSLGLVASKPGSYSFDIGLRAQARLEGTRRTVRIALGASTAAALRLKYDPTLFKLEARGAIPQPDGALLFPDEGAFLFSWSPLAPSVAQPRTEETRRPAVEPIVERARASVVSTLAGRRIVRVLYELKLEGPRSIAVRVPEGYTLERIFVNGAARERPVEGGTLSLQVVPERAGDPKGRLELLLSEEPGRFMLSGAMRFTLPAASWRTDEYTVELHLPEVFNYRWRGGSLSPCDKTPEPAEFSSQLPTPGKALCLRQSLVFEPPTADVAYNVDLAGKYWAGKP